MRIEVRVEGLNEAVMRLARAQAGFIPAVSRALYQWGERVMAQAKRIVPYDTGALESSGQVHPPEQRGQDVEVVLGFGNSAVGYAVYVHENLRAQHAEGRRAKFLEEPFMAGLPVLRDDLNAAIAGMLRM